MGGKKLLTLMGLVFALTEARAADPVQCPEGIGAAEGDEPQLTHKTGKWTLAICGHKANRFNRDIFSEFNVYYFLPGKKPIKLPFEASAADDYGIRKTGPGLTLMEMALIDNEWLPLFVRHLKCSPNGCKMSRKYCANAKPKVKPKSARALIETYRQAKPSSTGQSTDEAEIDVVLAAALGGEKEAIEAFEKNPGFRLDGASAEHYEYGKRTLKQLKSMKCKF